MKTQKEINELIQKFLSGDTTKSEEKILQQEAKVNPDVNDILNIHEQLKSSETNIDLPEDSAFQKMREGTINKLYQYKENKISLKLLSFLDFMVLPFRIPLFTSSFATAMLILGIVIGNISSEDDLLSDISLSAQKSNDLQSSTDAPYFYSNAQFKEHEDGIMEVSFDVSRHINLQRQKNDPLIQDILAQSLVNSKNLPNRLQYISESEQIMHPKIKEALINTMLNDEHPIVRQKSMSSLLRYANDEMIQHALFQVLENEQSVYMRLAAVEYLADNKVDEELLNSELKNLNSIKNSAVKQKLKQLNYTN